MLRLRHVERPLGHPLPVDEQVVSIFAGTRGFLDDLDVADVRRFESEFLEHLQRNGSEILSEIRDTGKLEEDNEKRLTDTVNEFKKSFEASDGSSESPSPVNAGWSSPAAASVSSLASMTKVDRWAEYG